MAAGGLETPSDSHSRLEFQNEGTDQLPFPLWGPRSGRHCLDEWMGGEFPELLFAPIWVLFIFLFGVLFFFWRF